MSSTARGLGLSALLVFLVSSSGSAATLPGLLDRVEIITDVHGVPHIDARNDHDVYFMMGYAHARDRFFQMDVTRRQASGTLAELLGPGPLGSDIQLRTIGLRRAAQRSRAAYPPYVIEVLQAYADGVNAFLDTNPLPPEYAGLEITKAGVPRWSIDDSLTVIKLLAFGLSFDNADITNTTTLGSYRAAGQAAGFDGTRLFFDDVMRSAPFDPTVSIPSQQVSQLSTSSEMTVSADSVWDGPSPELLREAEAATSVEGIVRGQSNWFVISGSRSQTREPMLANDPHLSLTSPPVFYEIHLQVRLGFQSPLNVYGVSFPGAPAIVQGFNERVAWGSTVNPMDVTDFFQERIVVDSLGRLSTLFRGTAEPIVPIPETFRRNVIGDGIPDSIVVVSSGVPPATLVVPRRNNGPLVTAPAGSPLTAISVQYSGFSATRELETFLIFSRARNIDDFKRGLQFFDVGSQNWSYMDVDGNIAYFTSAELPLREDLQAGTVDGGIAPFFVRDGTGTLRHEWIRNNNPPPDQALPFEILPFAEMPQVINPPEGFVVNANNDPIGTTIDNNPLNQLRAGGNGILYLSPGYAIGNRAGRIDRLIREALRSGRISSKEMAQIQSNVQLHDAQVFVPRIALAFASALRSSDPTLAALGRDPAVAEAVVRMGLWDFSAPTGIVEGYDASDKDGDRREPSFLERHASVSATLYSLWRGQMLRNTIDVTLGRVGLGNALPGGDRAMVALRNLLDTFDTNHGRGASGLNFFDAQDVALPAETERDIIILRSVRDALNLLAGPAFAPAFGGSTRQDDYRWGKLHRIVFRHPLNTAPFNIPPGAGFTDLAPALPGIATDGGFDVVDASSHNPRAASLNGFMFGSGPARRFVAEAGRRGIEAQQVIPGGQSGIPGRPFFGSMLGVWLTNDFHDALFSSNDLRKKEHSREEFAP